MSNIFTQHPNSMNETYFQHLKFALGFGLKMHMGGLACIIHALFPFLFQKTGSDFLLKSTKDLIQRTPVLEERMISLSKIMQTKMPTSNG
jgi:hypothetical protein